MKGFEIPSVDDEVLGKVVEESGVGRECSLQAEVVWGGDDSASEVVVPDAVDDDAGEEVAGSVFDIGDPVGEAAATVAGAGPVWWWLFLPVAGGIAIAGEDLKEGGCGNLFFLIGIASIQVVGLRVKVGEPASVGMVFGGRKSFTGDLNPGDGWLGLGGEGFLNGLVELDPLRVALSEEIEEGNTVFVGQAIGCKGIECVLKFKVVSTSDYYGRRGLVARGDPKAAQAVLGVGVETELELESRFRSKLEGFGQFKDRGLVLANASGVHGPAGGVDVGIEGGSGGEVAFVLLMGGFGRRKFDRLLFLSGRCDKDFEIGE